jgi:apolipoprotein N-acyltransferase
MPFALELLLAAALGAVHSLPFVWTQAWPLQLIIVALLAWRVAAATPWCAAALGLAFGTAWLGSGTWWLFISMHRYGGLPVWLSVLAIALLCAALALYLAAAMAAFARWRSGCAALDALLFAALWLQAELARGIIFTGFPWVASGYAHVDGPLAALAPWLGVYGLGGVAAGLAAWIGLSARSRWQAAVWPTSATLALLVAASFAGPGQFSQPGSTLRVTLLQSNVAQDEKFVTELIPKALEWARVQLLAAKGDLVVAPETIIPLLPEQLDPGYWDGLLQHYQQGRQAALIGLPLGNEVIGYTNSAAGISAGTKPLPEGYYRYDKHHLVPFGEFIPDGFKWFTRMMNIPLGDFNRGPLVAPSFAVGQERVAANICYEDLFGEELAARFTDAAAAPTIFANISNIGWFGESIAVDQHLHISRMRALELQRPMLRATNTGATVVIDHTGRVTHALEPFTQGVLDAEVQGRTGLTPYVRWASRWSLWPAALLALAVVLGLVLRRRVRGAM